MAPLLGCAIALGMLSAAWGENVTTPLGDDYSCPKSKAWIHASTQARAEVDAACEDVQEEILARVSGQWDKWSDPHNNGTYTLLSDAKGLQFSRLTGNGKYTDELTLTLHSNRRADSQASCVLFGCSVSQVTSVKDFSTNYCNLRMLYCGSADGCSPVTHDWNMTETAVKATSGQADAQVCLGGKSGSWFGL
jgi:hypothetical protein